MNIDEIIEVLQAYKRGEAIEHRLIGAEKWASVYPSDTPCVDFSTFEYRVKPKLLECWVTVINGEPIAYFHTEDEASRLLPSAYGASYRKMREVVE